jgi:hypothetical protein
MCTLYSNAAAGIAAANQTVSSGDAVSPVGAGFIGAAVTIVVGAAVLGIMALMGIVSFGKKKSRETDNVPLRDGDSFASKRFSGR